jgi:lipid-A-disaccharide synthase
MHLFFSVGEPSGDQHAAAVIRELRKREPGVRVTGFGGPLMEQAGCRLVYRLTELAIMGVFSTLPLLWRFYRLVQLAERSFAKARPDAVVLVDFPGFNWWIARKAKAAGIPVFYYLPPQLWAWASWRIRRVRKYVDVVLCAHQFEYEWYAARGVNAAYVGHPFFDEVAEHKLDQALCDSYRSADRFRNVGLLPGSRNHEVAKNWHVMLEVVRNIAQRHPQTRFIVACYREEHRQACQRMFEDRQIDAHFHFVVGKTPEVIELADCCLMVSGSVSLEMLARAKPATVLYRIGRMAKLGLPLIRCRFITLPNLIADREIMPEFVSAGDPRPVIADLTAVLDNWLRDPNELARSAADMRELRDKVARRGATAQVAGAILDRVAPTPRSKAA